MQNLNINFTSKIKFVSPYKFSDLPLDKLDKMKLSVDFPWGIDQAVIGREAYTGGVGPCTAGAITNGKRVFLFHLIPTPENISSIKKIGKIIKEQRDELLEDSTRKLRGVILGAHPSLPWDLEFAKMIEKIIKNLGIKYSKFIGQPNHSYLNAHYSADTDCWMIDTKFRKKSVYNHFKEVQVHKGDQVIDEVKPYK